MSREKKINQRGISVESISRIEGKIPQSDAVLTFFDNLESFIPRIQRVFFLRSSSKGIKRGGHAHKKCNQFLISIKGEIEIFIKDTEGGTVDIKLNSMDNCFIPAGLWIDIKMSSDSILMVLCDAQYSEDDYIRQWKTYILDKEH